LLAVAIAHSDSVDETVMGPEYTGELVVGYPVLTW
jgi:hypothetical protein